MKKEKYIIDLSGCDDYTSILVLLTPEQAEMLKKLAAISQQLSESKCQPIMEITKYTGEPWQKSDVENQRPKSL